MGTYSDTDRTTVRIAHTDQEIRQQRDDNARRNVHAFASWQDDPAEWAADILAYLGLDVETSTRPSPVRLIPPDEVKGPGKRAPGATTYAEPEQPRSTGRRQMNHGKPSGYMSHRRRGEKPCDPCREAYDQDQNDRAARRKAAS